MQQTNLFRKLFQLPIIFVMVALVMIALRLTNIFAYFDLLGK